MTSLSTVSVCQQFTFADSLIEQPRNARRALELVSGSRANRLNGVPDICVASAQA